MLDVPIRRQIKCALRGMLRLRCRRRAPIMGASTIVIAPHFDDEVLGCGGTILMKRAAGAALAVVFMTDGRKSHRHLMPEAELCRVRSAEALAAGRVLGIDPGYICMLGYEEGQLEAHKKAATEAVRRILREIRPEELFMPYRADGNCDHVATNHIARAALKDAGLVCRVYEYPIWAWHHWPWSRVHLGSRSDIVHVLPQTLLANLLLLLRVNTATPIGHVLASKRVALGEYRSQMTRLIDDPHWLTLADVGDGEFLMNLLAEEEYFYGG